jgi:hypothetical protein
MHRRNILHKLGVSTLGMTTGMSLLSGPLTSVAQVLDKHKIKVTGIKTILIDNIPPFAGQKNGYLWSCKRIKG